MSVTSAMAKLGAKPSGAATTVPAMNLRGLGCSAPQARKRTIEVEARFRVEQGALDVLVSCGISFGTALHQDDQAYAPRDWRYGDDRIGVAFARLRTQLNEHLFTVKRPITDVRTCVETECVVSDRDAMHEALELMGFAPTVRIVKTRRSAQHGQMTFCFDELDGVGSFVEVEMLAREGDDLDAVRAEMEGLLGELGIAAEPCFDSYDTLVYEASRGPVIASG